MRGFLVLIMKTKKYKEFILNVNEPSLFLIPILTSMTKGKKKKTIPSILNSIRKVTHG